MNNVRFLGVWLVYGNNESRKIIFLLKKGFVTIETLVV